MVAAGSLLLTGCLDDSTDDRTATDETEPPEPLEESTADGSSTHTIQVSLEGHVPEDVDVLEAEQATDNEYVAQALEEASEAYEDGMEANLGDDEWEVLGFVTADEMDGVEETLGSSARYVEYHGVTYRVSYIVFSLET